MHNISITNATAIYSDELSLDNSIVKGSEFYFGKITTNLPEIKEEKFNLRCNKILLYLLNGLNIEDLIEKYGKDNIGVVIATTNSGIEEFEKTSNKNHAELGNPAEFVKEYFGLNNFQTSVSTACTSGIKAFSLAKSLLENDICKAVITGGVDTLASLPIYGFNALEVLSKERSLPFSKNRSGINIGEGGALFILEKDTDGIKILGIGETSDAYHSATPDPEGIQAAVAIKNALEEANLKPEDIDYINLHGTGTVSNDLMEANAVYKIFADKVPASSTKPITGHCLGASASIETYICYQLLKNNSKNIPIHKYDGVYDENSPEITLVTENTEVYDIKNCMCNAFGFGGTNAVLIIGK